MAGARAGAQGVLGVGNNATVVPRGTLRIAGSSEWRYGDARFPGPGASSATMPLGAALSLDTLGVAQLPALAPVQQGVRTLTGDPTFTLSLGRLDVSSSERVQTTRLTVAAGVTRWLQLDLMVPYVRTRANVVLRGNATGREGNVGANPALVAATSFAADTAFGNQLTRSGAAAARYCAGAGAGSAACAQGATLAADAQAFGAAVIAVYGGAPVVPTAGSAAQAAIDARAAALRTRLNAVAAASGGAVPGVDATGVAGALPLATPALQGALGDSALGLGISPLQTVTRMHLGDVEAGATVQLVNTVPALAAGTALRGAHVRVSAGAAYRFGTGQNDSPTNVADVAAGTGTPAVILHGAADLLVGSHFWASIAARYTRPRSDIVVARLTPAGVPPSPYAPLAGTASVARQRGSVREVDVTPRWDVGGFLSIGLLYRALQGAADRYGDGSAVPAVVGGGAGWSAQQLGGGIAFSNRRAVALGRSHLPIEAAFEHLETVRGANVVKMVSDRFVVRLYARVLGR